MNNSADFPPPFLRILTLAVYMAASQYYKIVLKDVGAIYVKISNTKDLLMLDFNANSEANSAEFCTNHFQFSRF